MQVKTDYNCTKKHMYESLHPWGPQRPFIPSEVHHQFLGLADIQLEAVVLTP